MDKSFLNNFLKEWPKKLLPNKTGICLYVIVVKFANNCWKNEINCLKRWLLEHSLPSKRLCSDSLCSPCRRGWQLLVRSRLSPCVRLIAQATDDSFLATLSMYLAKWKEDLSKIRQFYKKYLSWWTREHFLVSRSINGHIFVVFKVERKPIYKVLTLPQRI